MKHDRSGWCRVGLAFCLSTAACESDRPPLGQDGPLGVFPPGQDGAVPRLIDGAADAPGDGSPLADTGIGADARAGDSGLATDAPVDGPLDADTSDVLLSSGSDATMAQPTCNPRAMWTAPVEVGGLRFTTQPMVTMTSDELTVAWVLDAGGGAGNVFVADRAAITDPFGGAMSVMPSGNPPVDGGMADAGAGAAYFAFDRVGLSADGLTLVGVATDGLGMAEFTRNGRGQAFFPYAQPSRYAPLARPLMTGERLGDPVLAADGDDIVYSRYGQSHTVSVYEAFRAGPVTWGGGSPRQSSPLQMTGSFRKRPTSLSADRLTLLVWDEATGAAYGLFRNDPMGDFTSAQPYDQRFSLQMNGPCTRLYFVAPSGSGFGLFQVTAM